MAVTKPIAAALSALNGSPSSSISPARAPNFCGINSDDAPSGKMPSLTNGIANCAPGAA